MGVITVTQEGRVGAPADLTYRLIADDAHHQRFLPAAITDFEVVEGGVGAGTLHRFKVTAGGRTREYLMRVDEPEPGRVRPARDVRRRARPARRLRPRAGHRSMTPPVTVRRRRRDPER